MNHTIEILGTALHHAETVTKLIIFIILALFIGLLVVLFKGYSKFRDDYKLVMSRLKKFERNSGTQDEAYSEIKTIFVNVPSFIHPWFEFSEGIVKERKDEDQFEFRNTHEASDFFNADAIIATSSAWLFNFRLGTIGSIPNILTGLGIVGTFFGILSGIPEGLTSDAISKGIPTFLVGMKGAFLASLAGLICSLIFTLIEKYLIDLMDSQCQLISEKLDTIFRRKSAQDYLADLSYSSAQQLGAMKNLPLDFGKEVIKGITGAGVESIEISDSVRQGVALGFEQLASGLKEFNSFQAEFTKNVLTIQHEQSVIAQNFSLLNTSAVECAGTIRSASATLMEAATEVRAMVGKLTETTIAAKEAFDSQKTSAESVRESVQSSERTIFEFHKAQTEILGSLSSTIGAFKNINEGFSQQVANYHQSINSSLKSNLETFDDHLGTGVKRLGGGVNSLGDMLIELNTALTDANKVYRQLALVKNNNEDKT